MKKKSTPKITLPKPKPVKPKRITAGPNTSNKK